MPDLILLDLNLPGKDGREVLAEIKADEGLKHIPVVILTSSQDEEDILRSYQLHANCYISKPVRLRRVRQGSQIRRKLLVHDRCSAPERALTASYAAPAGSQAHPFVHFPLLYHRSSS